MYPSTATYSLLAKLALTLGGFPPRVPSRPSAVRLCATGADDKAVLETLPVLFHRVAWPLAFSLTRQRTIVEPADAPQPDGVETRLDDALQPLRDVQVRRERACRELRRVDDGVVWRQGVERVVLACELAPGVRRRLTTRSVICPSMYAFHTSASAACAALKSASGSLQPERYEREPVGMAASFCAT